ncbi:hypothetical protein [Microvirga ossetica]|nr:hypothetical protein [Microvirga ossetica]
MKDETGVSTFDLSKVKISPDFSLFFGDGALGSRALWIFRLEASSQIF